MAIYTSLTGLNGASADLSVIANNIANVGANGFKKSRTAFGDLIGASALSDPKKAVGIGTVQKGITQQFTQGSIQTTGNTLDLALTGNGFFITKSQREEIGYTRNGAFALDDNQFIVDGAGSRLQAFPTDVNGVVLASGAAAIRPVRIPDTSGAPQASTEIDIALNLPSAGGIPSGTFNRSDATTYNAQTSTTLFDALGNPVNATFYYRRLTEPTILVPTSTWEVRSFVGSTELDSDGAVAGVQPLVLTFDDQGTLTSPVTPVAYEPVTPPSGAADLVLSVDHGAQTTQLADPFSVVSIGQDGFAAGRLDSLTIDASGLIRAGFTNGDTQAVGKLALAAFSNPSGLKNQGDARWTATASAGDLIVGEAGGQGIGSILSGAIERSNVELTDELVNLIVAQRNFQANAKAVETDQAMITSVINLR